MWFPPLLFLLPDVAGPATFERFIFLPLLKWKRSCDNYQDSNLTNLFEFVLLTGMAFIKLQLAKLSFVGRRASLVLQRFGSGFIADSGKSY